MSILPENFHFTQGSLQDYTDCRRRFQLRYLHRLRWPAIEAEPYLDNEHRMRQGAAFHRLVQQHLSGIPADRLTAMLRAGRWADSDLERWWSNYLEKAPELAPSGYHGEVSVETVLSAPFGSHRLLARYDAIFWIGEGLQRRALIVDWKTSQVRHRRSWLASRLQTHVYPYVLARTWRGAPSGNPLPPENITMIYWFPAFPDQPERFSYDVQLFNKDEAYLQSLVAEIAHLNESDFHLTPNEERCAFCTYRSLCDRGVKAGNLDQVEWEAEDAEFALDFDQIAELEF